MSHIADVFKRTRGDHPSSNAADGSPLADGAHGAPHAWTLTDMSGAASATAAQRGVVRAPGRLTTRPPRPAVAGTGSHGDRGARGIWRSPAQASPDQPLIHYWAVLARRWPTAAIILAIVIAGVAAGVSMTPPVYRAVGLLEIRPESAGVVPVGTLFTDDRMSNDNLETQFGILRSTTLAERVAAAVSENKSGASTDRQPGALSSSDVQKSLIIDPQKGSRLVQVGFDAGDPALAAHVVNAVLDNYLKLRVEEAQRTSEWLDRQVDEARQRLEGSERRLQTYVQQHGLQVLETGKGETADQVNAKLESLHASLLKAQADRMEKQSADELARRQAASRSLDSPVIQSLSLKLADLRREHAKLASVFHEEYPSVQALNDQIAETERALEKETQLVLDRGHRSYESALRQEALLRDALAQQAAAVQALTVSSGDRGGYESLKRELVNNQEQFAALSQKAKDVSISAALKAANVGIVDRAEAPTSPAGPPLVLDLALAGIVGLILGIGGVFLREHLDTTMRSVRDVDVYLGVPTLASIPAKPRRDRALRGRNWRQLASERWEESPLGEAFAALRTAVLLNEDGPAPRVLLITSADKEEGKTTVAVNLALSLARLVQRVLLVDANMRGPAVAGALGVRADRTLVDYFDQQADWRNCIQPAEQPGLDVLAGGTSEGSPADLLSLPRMRDLMASAAAEYDFVIVDAPAFLPHEADVRWLASSADSVLLVVRQGVTARESVSQVLGGLSRVSGVVLNAFNRREVPVGNRDRMSAAASAAAL